MIEYLLACVLVFGTMGIALAIIAFVTPYFERFIVRDI